MAIQSLEKALTTLERLSSPERCSSTTGDDARIQRTRCDVWDKFIASRGSRYKDCRFANYQTTTAEQTAVKESLTAFAADVQNVEAGNGLLLFGACGTGKDHLLVATARASVAAGAFDGRFCQENPERGIVYCSGPDLYSRLRSGIESKTPERETLAPLIGSRLLVLSDLCHAGAVLTPYQREIVGLIVDRRYNNQQPIWLSVNTENRQGLEEMMGRAIVDRLIDGAELYGCNWGSYRKPSAKRIEHERAAG